MCSDAQTGIANRRTLHWARHAAPEPESGSLWSSGRYACRLRCCVRFDVLSAMFHLPHLRFDLPATPVTIFFTRRESIEVPPNFPDKCAAQSSGCLNERCDINRAGALRMADSPSLQQGRGASHRWCRAWTSGRCHCLATVCSRDRAKHTCPHHSAGSAFGLADIDAYPL